MIKFQSTGKRTRKTLTEIHTALEKYIYIILHRLVCNADCKSLNKHYSSKITWWPNTSSLLWVKVSFGDIFTWKIQTKMVLHSFYEQLQEFKLKVRKEIEMRPVVRKVILFWTWSNLLICLFILNSLLKITMQTEIITTATR